MASSMNPAVEQPGSFSTRSAGQVKDDILSKAVPLSKDKEKRKIQIGVMWDFYAGMPPVDLDVACTCFSSTGTLVDAAFYNQKSAVNGAVTHSGDVKRGDQSDGFDEVINVDLPALGSSVSVLVFTMSCFAQGDLSACESAMVEVKVVGSTTPLYSNTAPPQCNKTGVLVGVLFLHPDLGTWHWSPIGEPVKNGRTFMAALPQLRKVVDCVLDPGALSDRTLSHDKTFNMVKGDVTRITSSIRNLKLGLGWSTVGGDVDLDASCILLKDIDGDGKLDVSDLCYFGNKVCKGVQSMGDNRSGEGEGDDETIVVNLDSIDASINCLAFTVNVYSGGKNWSNVTSAYVRLFDAVTNHEFCRYKLDIDRNSAACMKPGLVFCTISRTSEPFVGRAQEQEWDVAMIGEYTEGKVAREIKTALWDSGYTGEGNLSSAGQPSGSTGGDGCCVIN